MCNLYNVTTSQQAIIKCDMAGYLEPSIDPDQRALIVRNGLAGERGLVRIRWGLPRSSQALFVATKK